MPIEISYNSERLHYVLCLFPTPIFKKIYKDDRRECGMHWYGICGSIIPVRNLRQLLSASLQPWRVKNVESGNTMGPTVEAVKTSLMGPTGVIGDAFFQTGGFRIISASIGASMCIAGNPFGLLLYFLIYNVPNYLVHWWGIHQGFKWDRSSLKRSLTPAFCKSYRFMSNLSDSVWLER